MAEDAYNQLAELQLVDETERRRQAELDSRAAQMRVADERAAAHQRLCKKHGLPETATRRMIADAEILFEASWRDFIWTRYAGSNTTGNPSADIEHPDAAVKVVDSRGTLASAEEIEKHRAGLRATRDRLRKQFEKEWPPGDLTERIKPGSTDGVAQLHGHNIGAAA